MKTMIIAGALLLAAACGKDSKEADKAKAKTQEPSDTGKDKPADKPPAVSAKKLPGIGLQADVADSWTIGEDKVQGGATLNTSTASVSINKDGVGGMSKMTLDEEKKLMGPDATEVKEETLADGWAVSFKSPGMIPYHATVYRNLGADSYRCVIIAEDAAQMTDGIAVCKSLRP
jgi:hypothetical protein